MDRNRFNTEECIQDAVAALVIVSAQPGDGYGSCKC
jgi:hypothetical protein